MERVDPHSPCVVGDLKDAVGEHSDRIDRDPALSVRPRVEVEARVHSDEPEALARTSGGRDGEAARDLADPNARSIGCDGPETARGRAPGLAAEDRRNEKSAEDDRESTQVLEKAGHGASTPRRSAPLRLARARHQSRLTRTGSARCGTSFGSRPSWPRVFDPQQ